MKRIITALFVMLAFSAYTYSQSAYLSPVLENEISKSKEDKVYSILVVMDEQIDFEELKAEFNAKSFTIENRAKTVLNLLQNQSKTSQKGILDFIKDYNHKKGNDIKLVNQYWISNLILIEADLQAIYALQERNDIRYLELGSQGIVLVEPVETEEATNTRSTDEPEIGLIAINAPAMWALGYTGRGTLIYGYDTGVWPDHPAFSDRYLGRFMPQDQCWYGFWNENPTGILNNHGTHTLGTAIGLDRATNDTIGVAFDAYWIATDIVKGTIDDIPPVSDMVEAFEWALNPDGDINTVNDIPHVINNSWRWRDELDTLHCEGFVVDLMNAIEAVGIANVFSGGNSGPNNPAINSPQRIKTNVVNTFCVGAIDGNIDTYPIVSFSTRGPSQCPVTDAMLSIHPEVVAPGYNVRSAWNSDEYNSISGTSMSCPHVSGALLLLKEAYPYLTGEELMKALYYTAIDMGEVGEDNLYGRGLIDVYAAYEYLALTYTPVPPVYAYDISISSVFNPEIKYNCDNNVEPEILISNLGDSILTSFKLYYSLNDAPIDSIEWTGNLLPGTNTGVILPEITFTEAGENVMQLEVVIEDTFDEVDYYNNKRYFKFYNLDPLSIPYSEGFENGIDTTLWHINNPNNGITWDTLTTYGLDTSTVSLYMDFSLQAGLYEIDEITSPAIDISSANQYDTITVSFDLAYQKRSNTFTDSLKIYLSTDCGNTFPYLIYAKDAAELSTFDVETPNFLPQSNDQWRREHIHVTGMEQNDKIRIKFWGWNKKGNNLYIDNLRIDQGVYDNVEVYTVISNIKIFPNPARDMVHVNEVKVGSMISIYDTMGKNVYSKQTNSSNNSINTESFNPGIYLISVISGDYKYSYKLVIK